MEARRPGIASTDRPRAGSLASLLRRIREDEDALDALVFAYSRLPKSERWALAHAVLLDSTGCGTGLAALIAAEEDESLRGRLAGLLRDQGPIGTAAALFGGPADGEACLVHWVAGRTESLRAYWSSGKIDRLAIETEEVPRLREETVIQDPVRVIDTLAPLLWRHIREGGSLPDGIERFAGFFCVRADAAQW
ncbi:MAG: hypothetical protein PVH21_09230 [Myxococcales bacterium]